MVILNGYKSHLLIQFKKFYKEKKLLSFAFLYICRILFSFSILDILMSWNGYIVENSKFLSKFILIILLKPSSLLLLKPFISIL